MRARNWREERASLKRLGRHGNTMQTFAGARFLGEKGDIAERMLQTFTGQRERRRMKDRKKRKKHPVGFEHSRKKERNLETWCENDRKSLKIKHKDLSLHTCK